MSYAPFTRLGSGYDVILLAGQSNISGGENTKDVAIDVADDRISEWPGSGANVGTIQPAVDPLHHTASAADQVGPGIPFARWFNSQSSPERKVLLVPCGYGGTGFEASGGQTVSWKVSYSAGTNLYTDAIAKTNAAIAAGGPGSKLAGILWCQGEADHLSTPEANYQTNLLALIDGFRANIVGAAKAPFVILSIVPEASSAGKIVITNIHIDTPYLREFCGYTQGILGHSTGTLGVHYDATGQRLNGSVALPGAFLRARGNEIGSAPNPPTNVAVTRSASPNTTVNVTWTAPLGRVTDYTVQYRNTDIDSWSTLSRSRSLDTNATITDVGLGTQVRVLTVNENGSSAPSRVAVVEGIPSVTPSRIRQHAAYTLTSSTSVQKLFNGSTNAALTLPIGTYRFRALYSLSAMSSTTGNSAFSLAGTAVLAGILMQALGNDGSVNAEASQAGSMATTASFPASQVNAGISPNQQSSIEGTFEVTTAGTIIPSVALVTAAAAIVAAGSFFECWRVGATTDVAVGAWT